MYYLPTLDSECITVHPSSDTLTILKIYQLSTESSFIVKDNIIEFQSGLKSVGILTMTASSDIEHKHWCYALEVALAQVRKETKTIVPPPHFPVHSGSLLYMDDSMKWKKTYVVVTEDCVYFHEPRRNGFGSPLRYVLTPNAMIFATTLNEHSFEVRSQVDVHSHFILLISMFASYTDRITSWCCSRTRFT